MKTMIIMATYNGVKHLEPQLDSLRLQTKAADAVLFRDDASTDGTAAFLQTYVEKYGLTDWKVLQNQENIGWRKNFRQLMKDAEQSSADIIFFSDQDDSWAADKIERQLTILSEHPEIELLTTDFQVKKTDSRATENHHYHSFPLADKEEMSQFPARVLYKSVRPGWTMAVRRRLLTETLAAWTNFDAVEVNHDALLEGIAGLLGTGYNLNRQLGEHLRHGENASGRPVVSLKSSQAVHIKALYDYYGFFSIMAAVLSARNSERAASVQAEANFYQRRYAAALTRKKSVIFRQVLRDWKCYENNSGRLRDVIFAFKK